MKASDLLRFSFKALTSRKTRAMLTIIGIVIGPAAIVALVAATQGFSNSVTSEFDKLGATSVFVSAVGRGSSLSPTDVAEVQGLSGVSNVIPFFELTGTIKQGTTTTPIEIFAGDFNKLGAFLPGLTLASGSEPTSTDLAGAVIGSLVANPGESGVQNYSVGQIITVNLGGGGFTAVGLATPTASGSKSFIVDGVFKTFGQSFFLDPDEAIFIPLAEGQALLQSAKYTGLVVVASSTADVSTVSDEITSLLGSSYRITTVGSVLTSITTITSEIGTILASVAGVSLLVAFVGIMTTMFTTVIERTKEIGILKALGYTSGNILSMFVAEAFITGLVGGLLGAGIGAGLSYFVVTFFKGLGFGGGAGFGGAGGGGLRSSFGGGSPAAVTSASTGATTLSIVPAITPELLLLAVGLAMVVGTVAGLIPAWRASRLTPVEALHSY